MVNITTPIPQQVAPGFRFLKDLYPASRGMGLELYPYSSIYTGLTASWTLTTGTVATAQSVTISPGTAYLDGQLATLAASATVSITPNAYSITNGTSNNFYIVLNPTRNLQPILSNPGTPPTTLLNGNAIGVGNQYAICYDRGDSLVATTFYKYGPSASDVTASDLGDAISTSNAWFKIDPSFETPTVPAQQGQNRMWGGDNVPVVTASNFTVNSAEAPIFIGTQYPPYVSSNSLAQLRQCGSLLIATLVLQVDGSGNLVASGSSLLPSLNLARP